MKKLIHILFALLALSVLPAHAVGIGGGRNSGVEKQLKELRVPDETAFIKLDERELSRLCGKGSRAANEVANRESNVGDKRGSGILTTGSPLAPRVETLYSRAKAALADRASDPALKAVIDESAGHRNASLEDLEKAVSHAPGKHAKFDAISVYLDRAERIFQRIGEYKRDNKPKSPGTAPGSTPVVTLPAGAPATGAFGKRIDAGDGTKGAGEVLTKYPTPFGKGWVAATEAEKALIPNSGNYPVYKYEPDGHFMIWYLSRFLLIQNKYGAVDVKDTARQAARAAETAPEKANILRCNTADNAERARRKAAGIHVPPMSPAEAAAQKASGAGMIATGNK